MTWHFLDADRLAGEFASALSSIVPTIGWIPEMSWTGCLSTQERTETQADPPLQVKRFALQRGYHLPPFSHFLRFGPHGVRSEQEKSVLVCTTPYYAPVAERWRGPVVYYLTDLMVRYHGANAKQVMALDRRMCAVADLVCPNSLRIADYLSEQGCAPWKALVLPNATRLANVFPACPAAPSDPPSSLNEPLSRPIAGVIGNLAGNMDWVLLRDTVRHTHSWLTWAFVGPTEMPIMDRQQHEARRDVMGMGGRVRFLGAQPYGVLKDFARCFDVAVLPYLRIEPTYSGSSTRFYEHLAACRPMLATRGFEELLHKPPLLTLVDTADEMTGHLERLRGRGFQDGQEAARWQASSMNTWHSRAKEMESNLRCAMGLLEIGMSRGRCA